MIFFRACNHVLIQYLNRNFVFQVLQNVDELFDREELSAAPDAGWPDCFNSGVFVFRPSEETYDSLLKFAMSQGSFDGMTYVRLDVLCCPNVCQRLARSIMIVKYFRICKLVLLLEKRDILHEGNVLVNNLYATRICFL